MWLGLRHIGLGAGVGVGEAIVAQTQRHQPAVADLPLVFDVLGALAGEKVSTLIEDALVRVVAAGSIRIIVQCPHTQGGGKRCSRVIRMAVNPPVARARSDQILVSGGGPEIVDTGGDGMAAQGISQGDTQIGVREIVAGIAERGNRLIIGNRRTAVQRRILSGDASEIRQARIVARRHSEVPGLHAAVHGGQGQLVREIAGELGRPHVTTVLGVVGQRLEAAIAQIVVIVVVDRTLRFMLLGSAGQLEHVAVGNVPVDLGIPLRRAALVMVVSARFDIADRIAARSGHLSRSEKEQAILDQRATHIGIVDRRPVIILAVGTVQASSYRCRGQAVLIVGIARIRAQIFRLVEQLTTKMPLIGASLADHVEDTAITTPILGAVATGIDFFLVDRAIGQGNATLAQVGIAGIESIDVVRIFRGRRTTETDQWLASRAACTTRTGDCRRCQKGSCLGSVRQRQPGQLICRENRARIHRTDIDRRQRVGGHFHARELRRVRCSWFGCSAAERNIRTDSHVQHHIVARLHRLPVMHQGHRVGADRKLGRVVSPLTVDTDSTCQTGTAANGDTVTRLRRRSTENAAGSRLCVYGVRAKRNQQPHGEHGSPETASLAFRGKTIFLFNTH